MDRNEAISRLQALVGKDLRVLADQYGVTVWSPAVRAGVPPVPEARLNKGWAGQTIERHLGLPTNSSRAPDFGTWELKLVPVKRDGHGALCVKETMAITMIDPDEVSARPFEESHLFAKLQRAVVASRIFESKQELRSELNSVGQFDLGRTALFDRIKRDYDLIRATIRNQGFDALSGAMGTLVQPRTKGAGHGSTSRAFYARTPLVSHILGMRPIRGL
jgi:DNA mismatch repair protein MutH